MAMAALLPVVVGVGLIASPAVAHGAPAPAGSIFSFGDAPNAGAPGPSTKAPVVGVAMTRTNLGYWVVTADGGVFTYGDAPFYGSNAGVTTASPIVALAATRTGHGYWLVAGDGGVFTFGDATFHGSLGAIHLNSPIVGVAPSTTGNGYWLLGSDGGVFSHGDAPFLGSAPGQPATTPAVGIAATSGGRGYVVATGTKPPAALQLTGVWACIALHESGNNPHAVNRNGHYGLFQFAPSTWAAVGGQGNPADASPQEQLKRAQILQARAGWSQWSTAGLCGV
jgi:hypothetical protein